MERLGSWRATMGFLRSWRYSLGKHFPVTIGLPVAAVISLLLILVLRETTGKLEFEALGFKFRGASGPVVLWVLCYLAITLSIKLLW